MNNLINLYNDFINVYKNSFKSFPLSIPTVEIIGKSAVMIILEYAKSREL